MTQSDTRSRANVIVALILIGIGAVILLGQWLHLGFLWPLFIIVPGLMFFVGMAYGGKAAGPLAIPGSIVTTVGLILLAQSWMGRFETWAYAWALIPVAVGVGMVIHGAWSGDTRAAHSGRRVMMIGVILFLVFGAFFELLIFRAGLGRYLFPALMIGVGVWLLLRRGQHARVIETPVRAEMPPTRPSAPTQPKAPTPPAAPKIPEPHEPQFEPLDMTRGKKNARKPKDTPPQV